MATLLNRRPPLASGASSCRHGRNGGLRAAGLVDYKPGMLKHNNYFEGGVQSIGFERHGTRQTVGVIDSGEYHFDTDGPERMAVISGELDVRFAGSGEWRTYAAGTSFEIAAKSGFDVRANLPAAYLCEFL